LKKHSVHRVFLGFFAILALAELAAQTANYANLMWHAGPWALKDAPFLFRTWFYGLDAQTIFGSLHIDGTWPTLLITLLAYVGSRIPEKSRLLVPGYFPPDDMVA
jgi:hypothetical protein